jgi:hypothetical protein
MEAALESASGCSCIFGRSSKDFQGRGSERLIL